MVIELTMMKVSIINQFKYKRYETFTTNIKICG